MAIKARGEFVDVTDQINLTVKYKDPLGNLVDTDSLPRISIAQPSGAVLLPPTSVGVTRTSTGNYSYLFSVPINGPYGIFNDSWIGFVGGTRIEASFQFIVAHTQMPGINSDGYEKLGDDVGFNYSQAAIHNINELIKSLRARLKSSGKSPSKDASGNKIYVDCDIFSVDTLVTFLATALWDFNQVPYFTDFQFDEDSFIRQFGEILVEGATIYAMASQALIERGREFTLSDNGINFTPPTVSDMLNTQAGALQTQYFEKLKYIKNSIRPEPLGSGLMNYNTGALNPAFRRLRHLRERKL
jgi:hypothetical protein